MKSLVNFPEVLSRVLSDKLDWTQKLGDAFIGPAARTVMEAVQKLRAKAKESEGQPGVTTKEQKVKSRSRKAPQTLFFFPPPAGWTQTIHLHRVDGPQ